VMPLHPLWFVCASSYLGDRLWPPQRTGTTDST
jgi:hypothetical protein